MFNITARALVSERPASPLPSSMSAPAADARRSAYLPASSELLFIAGQRPIAATKLRYYADPEFVGLFANQAR